MQNLDRLHKFINQFPNLVCFPAVNRLGDGVCRALRFSKQNKGGYARLTERGADIPGTAKNDSAAVKLAQEGKFKRWYVKTAKGQ